MEKVLYGTHAVQVYVTWPNGDVVQVWACGKCRRLWGKTDRHMASWCCCTHLVCGCGKEVTKHCSKCGNCTVADRQKRYYDKPEKDWDGEFPICISDDDTYFFDESDLIDHIYEMGCESVEEIVDTLQLSSCHEKRARSFDVNEWACDDLADDGEVRDADSINDRINEILGETGILSYYSNNDRLNVRQVLEMVGYETATAPDAGSAKRQAEASDQAG